MITQVTKEYLEGVIQGNLVLTEKIATIKSEADKKCWEGLTILY